METRLFLLISSCRVCLSSGQFIKYLNTLLPRNWSQLPSKGRTILGYVASGIVVGVLLVIQNALNYPRAFDLIELGIYNLFFVIHLLTVVSNPLWLALYLPLTGAEIWIGEGLVLFLFFLVLAKSCTELVPEQVVGN